MPQISRIRVVNCKYNDGNRMIPDELYDLSGANPGDALNALFNLNNGGGKTVLVQLFMQPILPRAKASNRRIEDYFTRPGDHSYVLIEWVKDGGNDKFLTGISIAASSSNSADDESRGNSIKYYTFFTEYSGQSPYDIASLDLSKNENGRFVAEPFEYVRDKAKASRGALSYFSSDEGNIWEEKLAEYGVFKSEWNSVIETLNKDEGGLNQYFDEAKTSDKLISKFFIPAIEKKMDSGSAKGQDSSLETMIINYARKISEKEKILEENKINTGLLNKLKSLQDLGKELYSLDDALKECVRDVFSFRRAIKVSIDQTATRLTEIEAEIEQVDKDIAHIRYEEASKEYYEIKDTYDLASEAYEESSRLLEASKKRVTDLKEQLDLLRCANLLLSRRKAETEVMILSEQIRAKETESDEAAQIAKIKYSVKQKAEQEKHAVLELCTQKKEEQKALETEKIEKEERAKSAKKESDEAESFYIKTESELNALKKITNRQIENLELEVIRRLDGFYERTEIEEQLTSKRDKTDAIKKTLEKNKDNEKGLTKKIHDIDVMIPQLNRDIKDNESEISQLDDAIKSYLEKMQEIDLICEKNNLNPETVFDGRLISHLQLELNTIKADAAHAEKEKTEVEKKILAVGKGAFHVLSEIIEYIDSVGIGYQTGENYLCTLLDRGDISKEKTNEMLTSYPELAYSILLDNEADIRRILSAGNITWLPALVPMMTLNQMNDVLNGEAQKGSFLAIYDKEYFRDKHSFQKCLEQQHEEIDVRIAKIKLHIDELQTDIKMVEAFDYSAEWHSEAIETKQLLENKKQEIAGHISSLEKEKEELTKKRETLTATIEHASKELKIAEKWIEDCENLLISLDDELHKNLVFQDAAVQNIHKKNDLDAANKALHEIEERISIVTELLMEINGRKEHIERILVDVNNATPAELIDADLEDLYIRYQTLITSLSQDIGNLKQRIENKKDEIKHLNDKLDKYSYDEEEYAEIDYSDTREDQIRSACDSEEKKRDGLQEKYDNCNSRKAKLEERFNSICKIIEEFGEGPLPKSGIGDGFANRIAEKNSRKHQLNDEKKSKSKIERQLEVCAANIEDVTTEYDYNEPVVAIVLKEDFESQWKEIKKSLVSSKKAYDDREQNFSEEFNVVIRDYRDRTLPEIITKFQALNRMLNDHEMKGDRLFTIFDGLETMAESIDKMNRKNETDIQEIENDFRDIVDQCVTQGKRLYRDLNMIAASSRVHLFEGKPQIQMVSMNLPKENEIAEEASRISIQTEIENGANELRDLMKQENEVKVIQKKAKAIVGSEKLLHKYIRQESISVRVYKIDINRENSGYKRWEDTLTQSSGAEKFVAFFAVVLTLMNYTRASEGIMERNAKSVLILDNPFGKITSAHLLQPMFEIAKHFHVQLICLSDINKSDVLNCFETVIKLIIKPQSLSNMEIMTHEGNEKIEHGYYKIMNGQMSLFD